MAGQTDEEKLDGQQQGTPGQPSETMAAQNAGTPEPEDLAEAFKAYRNQNTPMADNSVPAGETGDGVESGVETTPDRPDGEGASNNEGSLPLDSGEATNNVAPTGGQGQPGGFADATEGVDFSDYGKTLIDEIGKTAIQTVQRKFAEQGIGKITISQLYQRDENSGSVSFTNPDDPRHPFSSRAEAQAWCNAFNQDVDAEFRKAAVAEREALLKQYKPTMELLEFAPKFETFDPLKKELINEEIESYAIKDQSGKVIGYNCNLEAVASRVDKLIARFQANQPAQAAEPAQQQANQGTEPALDMKGSGSAAAGEKEPKDLGEALKMLQSKKKGKK